MVAPIIGYTDPTINTQSLYRTKQGQRQAKPYDRALPYSMKEVSVTSTTKPSPGSSQAQGLFNVTARRTFETALFNKLKITAYDRFLSVLGDRASVGENLAELGQTAEMVVGRFNQIRDFTAAVRGKRYQQAAEILLMKEQPRKVTPIKAAADNWLEYWYGVRPLIGDIYSGIEILSDNVPSRHITASAKDTDVRWDQGVTAKHSANQVFSGKMSVRYGAYVQVTNPNTYLLNRLGLLNPVQLGWQVTKYSLVVDWFYNVEQYLGTMTDFVGLSLSQAYTTQAITGGTLVETWNDYGWRTSANYARVDRTVGISTPALGFKGWKPFSAGKLAAAGALAYGELFRLAKKSGSKK